MIEGGGIYTKQNVLPVPWLGSEGEAGLTPHRRLCVPTWLTERPLALSPQLNVQRGPGVGWGGHGLNTVLFLFYMLVT